MAHEHIIFMMLADGAAQARDLQGITRYAPRLEDLAERDEHRPYLAIAKRSLGVAQRLEGELEAAGASLEGALEIFNDLESTWQAGRTLYELGELELAKGSEVAAQDYFSQALERFEGLKAKPNIEQTREKMKVLAK